MLKDEGNFASLEQTTMLSFTLAPDHSTAVKLAAQAALETISFNYEEQEQPELLFPYQEYQDLSKESALVKEEVEEEEEEEEENEDFIVTTYKGRFQCPRPNCSKLYKNRNGLKYHLQKGSCRIEPMIGPDGTHIPTPLSSTPSSPHIRYKNVILHNGDPESFNKIKPFYCRKCTKRYKNLNGLKYHSRVEHPEFDFEEIKGIS